MDKLKDYRKQAMRHAAIESLGTEGFSAKIPGFPGLVVFGRTRRDAISELEEALEGWIELSLKRGYGLPSLHAELAA